MQYGSWTGACDNEIACSVLVCGSVYRGVHVQESVPQYGPRPPWLCTSVYVCTVVRNLKGFIQCAGARPPGLVLLCTPVRHEPELVLCGANPQGRYTVCWYSPTKASNTVLMCWCGSVRSEPASACAIVYDTSPKSFVRCDLQRLYTVCWCSPPGALHPVLMCSCGRMSR